MLKRSTQELSPKFARTPRKILLLDRLGGYLARAHDPPPGNTVMWRGLSKLTDIECSFIPGGRKLWVIASQAGRLLNASAAVRSASVILVLKT